MNVKNSPYASFLEEVIGAVMEYQPEKIAFCTLNPDGTTLTGYYGNCDQQDKAMFAHQIYSDSIMDVMKANAGMILAAAEEDEDEGC